MGQTVKGSDETTRAILESLASQGQVIQELEEKNAIPELLVYIWMWFVELSNERGSNGFGANPITSSGIRDWVWATGNNPAKWEIAVIKKLDRIWLESQPKDDVKKDVPK